MEQKTLLVISALVVLVLILLFFAYRRGDLNRFLPASWDHHASDVDSYLGSIKKYGCGGDGSYYVMKGQH